MKKFLKSLFFVVFVLGVVGVATTFNPAMAAFKGKTVDLNASVQADFTENAKIEGEIYYVYDCIAVEEVTHTTYGIKTGTDETNFYLIDTSGKDWLENGDDSYKPLTVLYSTSDKKKIAKLDKLVEDWYAFEEKFYSAETEEDLANLQYPSETLEISGMISDFGKMDELNSYRDEYIGNMGYEGEELKNYINDYCVDMIISDTDVERNKLLFIIAAAAAVLGIIGFIITLIASRPRKLKPEEFY